MSSYPTYLAIIRKPDTRSQLATFSPLLVQYACAIQMAKQEM